MLSSLRATPIIMGILLDADIPHNDNAFPTVPMLDKFPIVVITFCVVV